jgi:hypothetical protein
MTHEINVGAGHGGGGGGLGGHGGMGHTGGGHSMSGRGGRGGGRGGFHGRGGFGGHAHNRGYFPAHGLGYPYGYGYPGALWLGEEVLGNNGYYDDDGYYNDGYAGPRYIGLNILANPKSSIGTKFFVSIGGGPEKEWATIYKELKKHCIEAYTEQWGSILDSSSGFNIDTIDIQDTMGRSLSEYTLEELKVAQPEELHIVFKDTEWKENGSPEQLKISGPFKSPLMYHPLRPNWINEWSQDFRKKYSENLALSILKCGNKNDFKNALSRKYLNECIGTAFTHAITRSGEHIGAVCKALNNLETTESVKRRLIPFIQGESEKLIEYLKVPIGQHMVHMSVLGHSTKTKQNNTNNETGKENLYDSIKTSINTSNLTHIGQQINKTDIFELGKHISTSIDGVFLSKEMSLDVNNLLWNRPKK